VPDIDIAQIAGSLMPKLNDKQQGFITTYLDTNYQSKYSELVRQFQAAGTGIALALGRVRGIVDQLAIAGRTKADFDQVAELRKETGAALTGLATKTSKRTEALALMQKTKVSLEQISIRAEGYVTKIGRTEGRDLGKDAAILTKKAEAQKLLLDLDTEFGLHVADMVQKVQEAVPGAKVTPAALTAFNNAFHLYSAEIANVPSNDPAVTVEQATKTLDGIKSRMIKTANEQKRALAKEADGESFKTFIADLKLRDQCDRELAKTRDWLVTLDRWEVPGRLPIHTELKRIEGEMKTVFADRKGLSPDQQKGMETRQADLLKAATAMTENAAKVAATAGQTFQQAQQVLVGRLVGLENRLKTVQKTVPKEQLGPIQDALATTRLAITGLNGSNMDALKAGETLLADAEKLVADAEAIKTINALIEQNISAAKKAANTGNNAKNPLQQAFAELVTEVTEFEKSWKTKTPSTAKTESADLLKRVNDKTTENTAIINKRVEVGKIIAQLETHLGKLDLAFKGLAKGTPVDGLAYGGTFKADLDLCKSWNATKTTLPFYDTIVVKLSTLTKDIDAKLADIEKIAKMSDQDVMLAGLEAQRVYDDKIAQLTKAGGDKGPDPAEVKKAKEERDKQLAFLNTKLDLLAEANKAVADREKDAADRETFMTESKQLEADIKREQKAAEDDAPINAYEDEIQRHLDRLSTTRDLLKKGQGSNGAAALSELKFVRETIQRIRDRGVKGDKTKLGLIADQWSDTVGTFAKSCAKLMTAIEGFEKEQGIAPPVSLEVQKVLERVIGAMNSHKFGEPAAVLGATDSTPAARKAAREKALDEVRRLRAVILADPVVQKCVVNPFGIGGLGQPVQYRLEDIELNVLRGV
jgi:hypothetical protein